jgi:hypothetical protein
VAHLRVNVSAQPVVAGFQVIIGGRFWVITEARVREYLRRKVLQVALLGRVASDQVVSHKPEIRQLRDACLDQDICRFDVTMNHLADVKCLKTEQRVPDVFAGREEGQRTIVDRVVQPLVAQLCDDIDVFFGCVVVDAVYADHVIMSSLPQCFGLREEVIAKDRPIGNAEALGHHVTIDLLRGHQAVWLHRRAIYQSELTPADLGQQVDIRDTLDSHTHP